MDGAGEQLVAVAVGVNDAYASNIELKQTRIVVLHLLRNDQQGILFRDALANDHRLPKHGLGDRTTKVLSIVFRLHAGRQLDCRAREVAVLVAIELDDAVRLKSLNDIG